MLHSHSERQNQLHTWENRIKYWSRHQGPMTQPPKENYMNVSERSLIYQFQLKALCAVKPRVNTTFWIPTNLCPYMRRFLRLLVASIFVYALLAIGIIAMLNVLAVALFLIPWDTFEFLTVVGGVLWTSTIIYLLHKWYIRYGKHSARLNQMKASTKQAFRNTWRPIGQRINCNIFVTWYRAVHDKICPELQFYDD